MCLKDILEYVEQQLEQLQYDCRNVTTDDETTRDCYFKTFLLYSSFYNQLSHIQSSRQHGTVHGKMCIQYVGQSIHTCSVVDRGK